MSRIEHLLSMPPANCIKCLRVIEILFKLLRNFNQIETLQNNNPVLKDMATRQAMHEICSILSDLQHSPRFEPNSL
jgi:hypothetical protein